MFLHLHTSPWTNLPANFTTKINAANSRTEFLFPRRKSRQKDLIFHFRLPIQLWFLIQKLYLSQCFSWKSRLLCEFIPGWFRLNYSKESAFEQRTLLNITKWFTMNRFQVVLDKPSSRFNSGLINIPPVDRWKSFFQCACLPILHQNLMIKQAGSLLPSLRVACRFQAVYWTDSSKVKTEVLRLISRNDFSEIQRLVEIGPKGLVNRV